MVGNKRSLLLEYFNDQLCLDILKVTMLTNIHNNMKSQYIRALLTDNEVPYTTLGSGTNRMAVLIDGYAVKIALDKDGMIDNKREFLYTKQLQPYVVKVYECSTNGLFAVTEYVNIFTLQEFHMYQDDMKEILGLISTQFLIGDVGVTSKNYTNWGTRVDGTICILDFAYIYNVKFNVFNCECDDVSMLKYDANYVNLSCPTCGRKYTFGELRRKISKEQQNAEIGDITRLGYLLDEPLKSVELVPSFEVTKGVKKEKKAKSPRAILKEYRKEVQEELEINNQDWDNPPSQELMLKGKLK